MSEVKTRHVKLVSASGAGAPMLEFQRSLAVVIGINDYRQGIPPLRTARADAERLAQILADHHAYETWLYTSEITGARLITLLQQELPQQMGHNDRLLFYFAGHGIALDGDDGPAGYLIPQDADVNAPDTFLPMQLVHDALTALDCRHCLVILDCCFSGAFRWSSTRKVIAPPKTLYRERYERFLRSPAWQVLTSAAYDQEALDVLVGSGFGNRGVLAGEPEAPTHSPFALALFDALMGKGQPPSDANNDGVVAATELYLYLRDNVEVRAKAAARHWQTPGLWPLKKHDKGEYIFLLGEPDLPPAPELTAENNPYRGLASYNAEDAGLFFGRQQLIETLAELVEANPLTIVLGASGTGKSSVVKAGLVPYLTGAAHRAKEQKSPFANGLAATATVTPWRALAPFRPTETPIQTLAEVVVEQLSDSVELADRSQLASYIETAFATWLTTHPDQKLLLIVDQWEELVTLCRDSDQRTQFQALLQKLLTTHLDRLHIILTLRTDFEPQFAESPLADRWRQGRFIIPPLTQAELRTVIEGPAGVRVLFFAPPELVDTLVDEVSQTPGALPLLSFTLEQLYLKYLKRQAAAQAVGDAIERALIQADYAELGGVIGSLRTRADEEYEALPDAAHRATMARLMVRMIAAEGGELVRRRVLLTELEYPSAAENQRVKLVINQLVAARLLVSDSADVDADGVADAHVEPAHDALVRAWDRLRRWQLTAEEELPLTLHRNLTQVANAWAHAEEKAKNGLLWDNNPWLPQLTAPILPDQNERIDPLDYLLNPRLLFHILVEVTTRPTRFNQQETAFIQQSARRHAYLWRRTLGITLVIFVILSSITFYALMQQAEAIRNAEIAQENENSANQQAAIALSRQLAAESISSIETGKDAELSILLALESIRRTQSLALPYVVESDIALRRSLATAPVQILRHEDAIQSVRFDSSSNRLIVISNNVVLVWDLGNKQELFRFVHDAPVPLVELSPDNSILASITENFVYLWDFHAGNQIAKLQHSTPIVGVKFNSQKPQILTMDESKVYIWETQRWQLLVTLDHIRVGAFVSAQERLRWPAFSRDGTRLITASSSQVVRLWDTADFQEMATLEHDGVVLDMQFSSDGTHFVVGTWLDRGVHLYASSNGEKKYSFEAGLGEAVQFSPDGRLVVAKSQSTIYSWDAESGLEVARGNHPQWITDFTMNADSSRLIATDFDGRATLWAMTSSISEGGTNAPLAVLSHSEHNPIRPMAFSSNGQRLATASAHIVHLWDATDGEQVGTFRHAGNVTDLQFSLDGRWLATASDDKTIRLWDINTESTVSYRGGADKDIAEGSPAALRHEGQVDDVVFGSHQSWFATRDGSVLRFVDTVTGEEINSHLYESDIRELQFSPNGQHFITRTNNNLSVWDTDLIREVAHYSFESWIEQVYFSPKGQYLIIDTINDRFLWHWALAQDTAPIALGKINEQGQSFKLSPDYSFMTVVSNTTIALVELNDSKNEISLTHESPVIDHKFSADGSRLVTIDADHTIALWKSDSGEQITKLALNSTIETIYFNANGSRLVIVGSGKTHLLDTRTGKALGNYNQAPLQYNYPFSPNDYWLVLTDFSTSPSITLVDPITGLPGPHFQFETMDESPIIQFSPNGAWLAVITNEKHAMGTDNDNTIYLWRIDNQLAYLLSEQTGFTVETLQFSVDEEYLLVVSDPNDGYETANDRNLQFWRIGEQRKPILLYSQNEIQDAKLSPNGDRLTIADQDTIILWSIIDTAPIALLSHAGSVQEFSFSQDGMRLASLADDGAIHIWDTGAGRELSRLASDPRSKRSGLEFLQDSRWLLARGNLWSVDNDNLLKSACKILSRNLMYDEWRNYLGNTSTYRPTCPANPIPVNTIELLQLEIEDLVRVGQLVTATQRLQQLNGWLQTSHQYDTYAISPDSFLVSTLMKMGREEALAGNVITATLKFSEALAIDNELDLDPTKAAKSIAAHALIEAGRTLARTGDGLAAMAKFDAAYRLEQTLDIGTEKTTAQQVAVQALLEQGQELARNKKIEQATAKFRNVTVLDPLFSLDPKSEAQRIATEHLLTRGNELVKSSQLSEAITHFEEALLIEPALDVHQMISAPLLSQGYTLALQGSWVEATAYFATAQKFEPTLAIDPESKARSLAVTALVTAGYDLARGGNIAEALHKLEEATTLDESLTIVPAFEVGRWAAEPLVEKGRILAQAGDIDNAIELFKQALAYHPSLEMKPEIEAKRIATAHIVQQGQQLARLGKLEEARIKIEEALLIDPSLSTAPLLAIQFAYAQHLMAKRDYIQTMSSLAEAQVISATVDITNTLSAWEWSQLCRDGSLVGLAAIVLPACERAVVLEQMNNTYRDSRAFARAAIGNIAGAIEDFNTSSQSSDADATLTRQRNNWVTALEVGINLIEAYVLARTGQVGDAIPIYQNLLAAELNIELAADEWNNLCWHGALDGYVTEVFYACEKAVALAPDHSNYRDSRAFASALLGDTATAIQDFYAFIESDTLSNEKRAQRQAWVTALEAGLNPIQSYVAVRHGDMSVVIPTYQRLNELAIPVTAEEWNNLCWHGAQNGHAAAVLFACDNAVALAPENGNYRDSRGVARALIGDMAGAIEDIEFAIQWAERVNEQADFIAQRQTWLVGLKLLQPFATGR